MMLLALYATAVLVWVLAIVAGPQQGHLRFGGVHHLFWGLLLGLVAVVLDALLLHVLALLLCYDDAAQHLVQRLGNPAYRSPLNRLTEYAYRIPGVRRLNELLDEWL